MENRPWVHLIRKTLTTMQPIKSISIPKPCHESWNQMTVNEQGRYCGQCCKTVTDFSVMSNSEIIKHLASAHNVCGRFDERQLSGINHQLYTEDLTANGWWKRMALAIGMLSTTFTFKAAAQTKPAVEQGPKPPSATDLDTIMIGKVAVPDSAQYRTITGHIVDGMDSTIVVGANIKAVSTNIGTVSDVNGNFSLRVPLTATELTITYIGYYSQTVNILSTADGHILKLVMRPAAMGGLYIGRSIFWKVYYWGIRRPFYAIFKR